MNGPTGLDYSIVQSVADVLEITLTKETFSKVQLMENEYLNIIDKVKPDG